MPFPPTDRGGATRRDRASDIRTVRGVRPSLGADRVRHTLARLIAANSRCSVFGISAVRWLGVASMLALVLEVTGAEIEPRRVCPPGKYRFVVTEGGLADKAVAAETLTIDNGAVSIASACGRVSSGVKVHRDRTRVRAAWRSCSGSRRTYRMTAHITGTLCTQLMGRVNEGARWQRRFAGVLMSCDRAYPGGDARLDEELRAAVAAALPETKDSWDDVHDFTHFVRPIQARVGCALPDERWSRLRLPSGR